MNKAKSMRHAWMHSYCFVVAEDELRDVPSKACIYKDKYDEYMQKRELT